MIIQQFAQHGIKLDITAKKVKNINFRIKPIDENMFTSLLTVSYPYQMPEQVLLQSLQNRLTWAIDCQTQLLKKRQATKLEPTKPSYFNDISQLQGLTLASEIYFEGQKTTVQALFEQYFKKTDFSKTDIPRTVVNIFKFWLTKHIEIRQLYWEYKVGKSASKITPYTMKTRWGSCSTQAKTIRLSVWLAQFELRCADYVLVHELCHLHHADHSPRFWGQVAKAMPDYKVWHDTLKNGNL